MYVLPLRDSLARVLYSQAYNQLELRAELTCCNMHMQRNDSRNSQFVQEGAHEVPKGGKYPRHVNKMSFTEIFLVII